MTNYETLQIALPTILVFAGAAWAMYRYVDSRAQAQAIQWRTEITALQARCAEVEATLATLKASAITGDHLEKSIEKIETLLTRELHGLRDELRQAHSRLDWFMQHPHGQPPRSGQSTPSGSD